MVFKRKASRVSNFVRARTRRQFSRKSGSSGGNVMMDIVAPSAVYGAVRSKASSLITGIIGAPLGDYTDEVALGVLGWFAMKQGNGFIKNLGRAAITVESASLGANLGAPLLNQTISGVQNTNVVSGYGQ